MSEDDLKRVLEALAKQGVSVTVGRISGLPFVRATEMRGGLPSGFHAARTGDGEWIVILKDGR